MVRDNKSDLGKILKQRRLMVPMTLQELAATASVSSSHLGRIERGERFPSARILRRLAKPLCMEEAELMLLAEYLSPESSAIPVSAGTQLDPYVSMVLSQESVEVQRAVIAVLTVLKGMARSFPLNSIPSAGEQKE